VTGGALKAGHARFDEGASEAVVLSQGTGGHS
jgi:hypothetical protein